MNQPKFNIGDKVYYVEHCGADAYQIFYAEIISLLLCSSDLKELGNCYSILYYDATENEETKSSEIEWLKIKVGTFVSESELFYSQTSAVNYSNKKIIECIENGKTY